MSLSSTPLYSHQIGTKQFIFRFPQLKDQEQMVEYSNEFNAESEFTLYPEERIGPLDATQYLLSIIEKTNRHDSVYLFAINQTDGGERLAGRINISLEAGVQHHVGELGISVRQEYRDQGLGRLMVELTIKMAKIWLPSLEIIQLTTFGTNARALHLYQELGFVEFGRLPKGIKRQGQYQDFVYLRREA
ncbi:MAG TPA: GNAT family protein [Candidatus Woesebacteria bacterium]|nr:GNAT family protein [Candidatus Woesebacteria bacterium]